MAICQKCASAIDDESAYCPYCGAGVPNAPCYDDYEYEAFISYRHLPNDRAVAMKLQRALEGFRIPKALQQEGGPKKLGRLFRDEDELPTSSSLSDQIRDALKRSPYLIVVCGRQTNESLWIAREVELFASFHGRDKIRLALVEGEPSESFPTLLQSRLKVGANGSVVEEKEEPLAADFRDLSRKKFNVEKLRLAAPLIGCGFDDLRQRQRARRQKTITGIASGVAAVSLAFGSFSYYQHTIIQENYRQVLISESEFMSSEAMELLGQGDRYQAVQVALAALPEREGSDDRPFVPAAQYALESALEVYPSDNGWDASFSRMGLNSASCAYSETGLIATVDESGQVVVVDVTGEEISRFEADIVSAASSSYASERVQVQFAGERLLFTGYSTVACYEARSGELVWEGDIEGVSAYSAVAVSGDGRSVALVCDNQFLGPPSVCVIDADTGAYTVHVINSYSDGEDGRSFAYAAFAGDGEGAAVAFADDGESVAVGIGGNLCLVDVAGQADRTVRVKLPISGPVSFAGDKVVAISVGSDEQSVCIQVFDSDLNELWSYDDRRPFASYTADGVMYRGALKICGLYQPNSQSRALLVALLNNAMVVIDPDTGDLTYRLARDTPFLDCMIRESSAGEMLWAITADGDCLIRQPGTGEELGESANIYDENLGEARAARFLNVDGDLYLALWSQDSRKLRVHSFWGRGLVLYERNIVDSFDDAEAFRWNDENGAVITSQEVKLLDSSTLAVAHSVEYRLLEDLSSSKVPGVSFSGVDGRLYVYGDQVNEDGNKTGDSVLYAINAEDGSVAANAVLHEMTGLSNNYSAVSELVDDGGNRLLIVHDSQSIRILSAEDGSEVNRIEPDGRISAVGRCGSVLLVLLSPTVMGLGGEGIAGYNMHTGEELSLDALQQGPRNNDANCIAADEESQRMFIASADGRVRSYDLGTDSLQWETASFSTGIRFVHFDAVSGNLLLQDEDGFCYLLSGKNGEVLKTTAISIPPLESCSARAEEGVVVGSYVKPGFATKQGLVVISMDQDAFGPLSKINQGMFLNRDGSLVAIWDSGNQRMVVVPRFSLDQLIEMGNEAKQEYPLTEAERKLYRVDD